MSVVATPYRSALSQALQAKINWATDDIRCILAQTGYTPNFDTDVFKDTVAPTEATGTGYTTGGVALASKTQAYTAANSWSVQWTTLTAYVQGQVVRPTAGNGHLYRCIVAGTTAAGQPAWPTTVGTTVVDGTVTWEECGAGITVLGAASPSWASSTISNAAKAVIFDNTPASSKPLIALIDFGGTPSSTNGTFQVTIDPTLGVVYFTSQ